MAVITSVQPAAQTDLSIEAFQRFVDVQSEKLANTLAEACGGEELCADLTFGRSRLIDKKVIDRIKILAAKGSDVKCLEIGSGTTCGMHHVSDGADYGSPWLSRFLAGSVETIDFTASDIENTLQVFVRIGKKVFIPSLRFALSSSDFHCSPLVLEKGRIRFEPVSRAQLLQAEDGWKRESPWFGYERPFDVARRLDKYKSLRHATFFIRPAIDVELEQQLFGLTVKANVSKRSIGKNFRGHFDFIFGRHQAYDSYSHVCKDVKRIATRLSPRGRLLLEHEKAGVYYSVDTTRGNVYRKDGTSRYRVDVFRSAHRYRRRLSPAALEKYRRIKALRGQVYNGSK